MSWGKQQWLGFVRKEDKTWQVRRRERKVAWELEKTKLQVLFLRDCCLATPSSFLHCLLNFISLRLKAFFRQFGQKT